jgi:hypothetical protein
MIKGSRSKRGALVAVAATLIAVPAVALAATPVKGGTYIGGTVDLLVARNGISLQLSQSRYCSRYPGWLIHGIKIKNGTFSFDGSAMSPHVHAVATGSFVTSHKATGTVKVGGCSKMRFAVTLAARG